MPEAVLTGFARSLHNHQGHGTTCAMLCVQLTYAASSTFKVSKLADSEVHRSQQMLTVAAVLPCIPQALLQ